MSGLIAAPVYVGQSVRLLGTVSVNGTLTNSTGMVLVALDPAGNMSNPSVVNDSTGNYHADLTVSRSGVWAFRWESAAPVAVSEGTITVSPSLITAPGF